MSANHPKPWSKASINELSGIRGICLDIDDTLSTSGKLTAQAYQSLWRLKDAGFAVVPITGRPAGWCDHFARFWPVDAVIGENGAFAFFMKDGIRKRIDTLGSSESPILKDRLNQLTRDIKTRFPKATWASDQSYREYDLAVDICEDVTPWEKKEVQDLLDFCHSRGAHAKLSSIHVNIWFGEYDKFKGFQSWIANGAPGFTPDTKQAPVPSLKEWIYIGDSPNDAPMFSAFPYSIGVANLKNYLDSLTHYPTWITDSKSGAGFTEVAEKLISAQEHA